MHTVSSSSLRRPLKRRLTRSFGTLLLGAAAALGTAACGDDTGELEILRVDPQAGAIQGQQRVTIQGRNFRPDIGYTVYFGAQRATKVSLIDPSTLQVETPSVPEPVEVDIVVRADDGPAFRIAHGYNYVDQSGNVMEQVGSGPARQEGESNLAY
ncbi:MAG: IPT/TIG domain-containing protein [Polyangiales bacterium]|nr:IPT/TIG domain-containing protein [Myxococcales bacterium]MCB9657762.1 IPT/TIG domain-containing protein [Sandaracinaceae bacterium]